jgi:hypothetical protein
MLAALREVAQQVQRDLETIERRVMQHNPHRNRAENPERRQGRKKLVVIETAT